MKEESQDKEKENPNEAASMMIRRITDMVKHERLVSLEMASTIALLSM